MKLWKEGDNRKNRTYKILVQRIDGGRQIVEKTGYIPLNAPEFTTKELVEKIKKCLGLVE